MRIFLVGLTILLAVFVCEASASPGVSLKATGLSFGNIRGEGKIVDGLSLTFGAETNSKFDEINGISFSIWPSSDRYTGITIGGWIAGGEKVNGIAMSLVFGAGDELNGVVFGGIMVGAKKITGLALSAFVIKADDQMTGVAFSSLNYAHQLKGIQIGFVNYTEHLNGVQIGFINYAGNNPDGLKWLPLINAHF